MSDNLPQYPRPGHHLYLRMKGSAWVMVFVIAVAFIAPTTTFELQFETEHGVHVHTITPDDIWTGAGPPPGRLRVDWMQR